MALLVIIKMSIVPNAIYRVKAIPMKIVIEYFTQLEQCSKRPQIGTAMLRKKNKVGGIMLLISNYITSHSMALT